MKNHCDVVLLGFGWVVHVPPSLNIQQSVLIKQKMVHRGKNQRPDHDFSNDRLK